MLVAVVGVGGMGGYYGARLKQAGVEVAFVARGENLAALRAHGLRLKLKSRPEDEIAMPVHATDDAAQIGAVDLVVFGVKTYHLEDAAARCRPLMGPDTTILPLQNGIDIAERLGAVLGVQHVLGGVSYVSAALEAPGLVVKGSDPGRELLFGELAGGDSERVQRIAKVFRQAGVLVETSADVRSVLWVKFIGACAGALTALNGLPIGVILGCPQTRELYRGIMDEMVAVARARGVALPADTVERLVGLISGYAPLTRTSLGYDRDAGRRLELESLNGTVVRLGCESGVPTPLNFALYAALKPFEDGWPDLMRTS